MPQKPVLYLLGLALTLLSFAWFVLAQLGLLIDQGSMDPLGIFLINYIISTFYLTLVFINQVKTKGWKRLFRIDEHLYTLVLILFSISAHSLNFSDIRLFSPYADWMKVYVLVMHLAVMAFPFRKLLHPYLDFMVHLILGSGLVLAVYLCIFLGPIIFISIPALILFGISIHALVPLGFFFYFLRAWWFKTEENSIQRRAIWIGMVIPILIFSGFLYQWYGVQQRIEEARAEYQEISFPDLPEWIYLSSALPHDPLTQRVLSASARTQRMLWTGRSIFGLNASEFTRHDPIALTAISLYGELDIDRRELVKIFETQYDCRHMTHRRLWRGGQLMTARVKSNIDIYPELRLAYEQMTLDIHHEDRQDGTFFWSRQQEAVYSFYLPEGAVATSLSLWINGFEEKSRLTTKAKADSAYRVIVGRERRDPALMHWQEGNRVSVTVFPCTAEEDRRFKIGFTTPLTYEKGRLSLRHVSFDGPATWRTDADIRVRFPHQEELPEDLVLPRFWKTQGEEIYYQDLYQPDWKLSFKAPKLNTQAAFNWEGMRYRLAEIETLPQSFRTEKIVLDVNQEWSWLEYQQILDMLKGRELYAYLPEPVLIGEANMQEVFQRLDERSFSLLPMYNWSKKEKVLVISKSTGMGPLLSDLPQSTYARHMKAYFLAQQGGIKWFSLSDEIPPYVQTLEELKLLEVHRGKMEELGAALEENSFESFKLGENEQLIGRSGMKIVRERWNEESMDQEQGPGPDHLFRLFAYEYLMGEIGELYFDENKLSHTWAEIAEEAYILSPVSSLIVLETQKDYERFGINENEGTVGNAAIDKAIEGGDGAIPEPHEWVLILTMAMLIGLFILKKWRGRA